jgi:hypothetical protein
MPAGDGTSRRAGGCRRHRRPVRRGADDARQVGGDDDALVVSQAELTGYVQYEGSDCLNGGILRVQDGYRFVENLPSHHAILATGDLRRRIEVAAQVLDLPVEWI